MVTAGVFPLCQAKISRAYVAGIRGNSSRSLTGSTEKRTYFMQSAKTFHHSVVGCFLPLLSSFLVSIGVDCHNRTGGQFDNLFRNTA